MRTSGGRLTWPMRFRLYPVSFLWATLALPGPWAGAAERDRKPGADDALPTPEAVARMTPVDPVKAATLLKDVKVPPEFAVSIFATPPAVNYPVFVAATPDGTVYVS